MTDHADLLDELHLCLGRALDTLETARTLIEETVPLHDLDRWADGLLSDAVERIETVADEFCPNHGPVVLATAPPIAMRLHVWRTRSALRTERWRAGLSSFDNGEPLFMSTEGYRGRAHAEQIGRRVGGVNIVAESALPMPKGRRR